MDNHFKNQLEELIKQNPSVLDERDYCVEMMDKLEAEGKDVDYAIELFDSCVQDLYKLKVPKDIETLADYVNDDELVSNGIIQHVELRCLRDGISFDYRKAEEIMDKYLPKA